MKMPATKVIKQTPVESVRKPVDRKKPGKVKAVTAAQSELKVPAVRKSRASSCPRCPQRDRGEEGGSGARRTALRQSCERRARSSSNAPGQKQEGRTVSSSVRNKEFTNLKMSTCPREQRGVRGEVKHTIQSHRAFTVIPPNPKKRREIQRKAEAELAALEELRLSRAMAYVSIDPSSVGGCMSLEEVRLKQQQEMMKAKRKPKPIKTQVMGPTPVMEI